MCPSTFHQCKLTLNTICYETWFSSRDHLSNLNLGKCVQKSQLANSNLEKISVISFFGQKNLSWPTQNPPHFSQKSQLATSLTEEAHGPDTHTEAHSQTLMRTHKHTNSDTPTNIHALSHTNTRVNTIIHTHTRMHTHTHLHKHTHTHTHMYTHSNTQRHTQEYTHTHTHTHKHMHTHSH